MFKFVQTVERSVTHLLSALRVVIALGWSVVIVRVWCALDVCVAFSRRLKACSLIARSLTIRSHPQRHPHRIIVMTAESFKEKGNEFFKRGDYERVSTQHEEESRSRAD
jgi:hypothetical protein